jgi:Holliday junction resolvase RusA-like endonuclease
VTTLAVTVPGIPAGQGRLSHVGHGRLVHSNAKKLLPWRALIAAHIRQQMQAGGTWPISGPVKVAATFYLPRPKAAVNRMWPHKRPDLGHLGRALLDAITVSGAIVDDSQVVMLGLTKCYGEPGMTLTLRPMCGAVTA